MQKSQIQLNKTEFCVKLIDTKISLNCNFFFNLKETFVEFYEIGKYFQNGKINLQLLDKLADEIFFAENWQKLSKSIFRQCNNEIIAGHSNIEQSLDPCSTKNISI